MRLFTCPICSAQLTHAESTLRCEHGHSFDIAREGYVNLLPSHHRRSAKAGDDSTMVAARRQFLESGHYAPLAAQIAEMVPDTTGTVLDIGCGEGYFTSGVAQTGSDVYGVDISKPAIRSAAKRHPAINFAVANNFHLPIAEGSFDTTLVILAPATPEVLRVTRDAGVFIRVTPGPLHLLEVKSLVYKAVKHHERASLSLDGFTHIRETELTFDMDLDLAARTELLAMTPMAHRTGAMQRLSAIDSELANITASFWIDVFEKLPAQSVTDVS